MTHRMLIDGFHAIHDKNGLGWAALDTKFERFALAAIAAAMNRTSGRVAHVELLRMDLVLLHAPLPSRPDRHLDAKSARVKQRYEAKAGQLFDFAPQQGTHLDYRGGQLNVDLGKLAKGDGAGLFFLSDSAQPNRHLKYYGGFNTTVAAAVRELERNVTNGALVGTETIDCGKVDGAAMKIHMCVFDRK